MLPATNYKKDALRSNTPEEESSTQYIKTAHTEIMNLVANKYVMLFVMHKLHNCNKQAMTYPLGYIA